MTVINRLPEIVYPLTQVNKVNEIVDVLNEAINSSYTEENPALTPVEGVATWTVTHNLGTENVTCTIYEGDNLVISKVSITSENAVTVSLNATSTIAKDTYKIVVMAQGSVGSSGGGSSITVDSSLNPSSTNPVQNSALYNEIFFKPNEIYTYPTHTTRRWFGLLTGSSKNINISFPLPKRKASNVNSFEVLDLKIVIRSNLGNYIVGSASSPVDVTSLVSWTDFVADNMAYFCITWENAFSSSSATNNTLQEVDIVNFSIKFKS